MTEAVGAAFDPRHLHLAQARTREAVALTAARIRPGMTEGEARRVANQALVELGAERRWHPALVRFGANTLCTYLQPSSPATVLGEDDVFFIDLGAVWQGHEGDAGATFSVGHDPEHAAAAQAARDIWHAVADHWRATAASGQALYAEAQRQAVARGWRLHLDIQGHRVSEFPHAAHGTPDLGAQPHPAAPDRWILEIQIRHPERPFGAFFEDLLTHKQTQGRPKFA